MMRHISRKATIGGLAALLAITVIAIVVVGTRASTARGEGESASPVHTQQVVNKYLGALDKAMANPSCDMSSLSGYFTADATVTLTGGPFAPGGPFGAGNAFGAQQYHGTRAIIGFFTKTCHVLYSKNAGAPSWAQDQGYQLAPGVLNSYEHVSLSGNLAGRCLHIFTLKGDRISSLDWSVYA